MQRALSGLIVMIALACAGSARADDAIDLHAATIHRSPHDIADWPVSVSITAIDMATPAGLSFTFDHPLPDAWKWASNPSNPSDNYQYTVWACVHLDAWHCAGFVQMWQGRASTGAPILSDFHRNWAYDAVRWGPMADYSPKVGDQMAFFVSAGNARGVDGVTSVRERSNVVTVILPAGDVGHVAFTPAPSPPSPPPPLPPPPIAGPTTQDLADMIASLEKRQADDTQRILDAIADLKAHIDRAAQRIGDTYLPLVFQYLGKKP